MLVSSLSANQTGGVDGYVSYGKEIKIGLELVETAIQSSNIIKRFHNKNKGEISFVVCMLRRITTDTQIKKLKNDGECYQLEIEKEPFKQS